MAPAARSSLDIALWFLATAQDFGMRLQPIKLQRLLYFAQVRYADRHGGAKLMPATFLATELGPLEPTVHHVFESGLTELGAKPPSREVETLLNEVWRRYGRKGAVELEAIVKADHAYHKARERGLDSEIELGGFAAAAAPEEKKAPASKKPRPRKKRGEEIPSVVGMMTMDGRRIRKWVPGMNGGAAPPAEVVAEAEAAIDRTAPKARTAADGRPIVKWVPGMRSSDLE